MRLCIYDQSRLVQVEEQSTPREAWRKARHYVRLFGRSDGRCSAWWYATRNRIGFQCGIYRATQEQAGETREPVICFGVIE